MEDKDEKKSWHQRKNESARQFELFEYYLSLEPAHRSFHSVSEKFALSRVYVERIAKKFLWTERSRNRNNYFVEKADEVAANAVKDAEFDFVAWEEQKNIRFRVLTDSLLEKCEQMLKVPIQQTTVEKIAVVHPDTGEKFLDKNGDVVYQTITTVKPGRWNASDTVRFAEAAVILTKYLAEQNIKPVKSPLPPPAKPVELMNQFERQLYIDELREKQRAIARGDFSDDIIERDDDDDAEQ